MKKTTSQRQQEMIDREYDRVMKQMTECGLRSDEATDFAMEAANAMAAGMEPDWSSPENKERLDEELRYLWIMSGSSETFKDFKKDKTNIAKAKENIRY